MPSGKNRHGEDSRGDAPMTERNIQTKVLKYLKSIPNSFVMKLSDRWTSGYPDILLCKNGHLWAIELKRPGLDATPLQRYILNAINSAGGTASVCHSVQEVKDFLTKLG